MSTTEPSPGSFCCGADVALTERNAGEVVHLAQSCAFDVFVEVLASEQGGQYKAGGRARRHSTVLHLQFSPASAVLCNRPGADPGTTYFFCTKSDGAPDPRLHRTSLPEPKEELPFDYWEGGSCGDSWDSSGREQSCFLKVELNGPRQNRARCATEGFSSESCPSVAEQQRRLHACFGERVSA